MESCKSIIEATATKWRWITKCWRLRLPVREALLAPKADTTESVLAKAELEFWKTKASETDKALKESKEANKALVHFIHTRNTPDVDLRAVKKAMATVALAFLPLLAMSQPLEPYRHNFFTTNPAPVVDVLPGTNVSVQYSLTGTSQRHYTVNTDTNLIPIYASWVTNGYPWTNVTVAKATSSVNSTNFWGTLSPTNLPAGLSTSNYVGTFSGDGTGLTNLYVGLTAGRIPVTDTGGILVTVPTLLYDDVLNQMIINENAVAGASSLVGTALSVRGADNAQIRIGVSSFGIAGAGAFAIRHARGTAALPTAISTGDQIMSLEGWGYGTTGYGVAPSVTVRGNAADAWTDTSMPSYITFRTTPTNSVIPIERMRIDPVGVTSHYRDSLGTSIVPQLWLTNSTAAALGAQQNSPAIMLGGEGWRSGNNTTHSTALGFYTLPVQGSSADPTMQLVLAQSVDGVAPTTTGFSIENGNIKASLSGSERLVLVPGSSVGNPQIIMSGDLWDFQNGTSPRLLWGDTSAIFGGLQWNSGPKTITLGTYTAKNVTLDTNGVFITRSDAVGTAITPILWLTNSTAAALGAQQNSPALMLGGQGWRSGNSTTHSTAMGWYTLPVQGSSADPTARLTVVKSVDGVAPTATGSWFDSQGTLNLTASATTLQCTENDPNSTAFQMNLSANGYTSTALLVRSLGVSTPTLYNMIDCRSDASFQTFVVRGDGFTSFGPRTSDWPSLKVETTNSPTLSIRTGNDGNYASLVASNITASGSVTATNNYIHQFYQTNGFTYCNSTNEYYLVNAYTNPLFVLPDASTVKGQKFEFTTTNQSCFFIVTNKTGTQTIANGSSLSYTNNNNGQKVVAFISDGAHWWLATKGRTILPSASWSCNTNITFPNVTNMVTLDTQEANNGVGITLDNSAWTTVGVGSRIWVTNAGMYLLTFSAMWAKTGGGSANGDVWIRQDGTMIPRTMTLQTIQNATSTNVMTVNFILPVTKTTYFDLVGASPDGTAHMQAMPAITSPFARPAAPSIIVTMQKTSD